MTSLTTIVKRKRKNHLRASGQSRKKEIRKMGSTPPFTVHPEEETPESVKKRNEMMKRR